MLRSIFSLVISMLIILTACGQDKKSNSEGKVVENISVSTFKDLYDPSKHILLDVRTQAEWDEGHLKDAILIDVKQPDFREKIKELDKDKAYIVYCKMGSRSSRAQDIMVEAGFLETYNVVGGITMMKMSDVEIVK